ncbi:MAG: threonylcarbamoyl-AMP synthase [Gammaproteobacteria bacterium]|nr:threonylcarbamoyl-AMP synthase [Gammaproteobacteria bacterium]
MTQVFHIHPDNPQLRLVRHAVEIIQNGGIVAYPTDSAYALGCHIGDKGALDKIRQIRELDKNHNFTLMCRDLSELGAYALVNNSTFRLLKSNTPGPFTFILQATKQVPRRLQNPKRKTVGLRIPDNNIAMAILEELGEPMMSVTLILPGDDMPLSDPELIYDKLKNRIDLVIDGGPCSLEPTTIVDFQNNEPIVTREGRGLFKE